MPIPNENDTAVVQQAIEGDAHAFETLVRHYYSMVYSVAYRWCGVRPDAEDIAQEVFVKLAVKLKQFRRKSAFKTWLYRITVNTAKDFSRSAVVRQTRETAFAAEIGVQNAAAAPEIRDAAELHRALARLPEKQKAAVVLVFGEGLSHKEAGRVLQCPEATVSWRLFQARKRLKKMLQGTAS